MMIMKKYDKILEFKLLYLYLYLLREFKKFLVKSVSQSVGECGECYSKSLAVGLFDSS